MKEVIRWGIIATGNIANKFATFFPRVKNAELMGVGSRKMETAKKFAHKYNLPKSYGSYQELVEDPDIDAVYIATPHHLHRENTLMALNSGKSVLCEKPFAINAQEAREMIEAVREKKLFLMEAMWMRFNPAIVRLRDLLKEKRIGQIASIKAVSGRPFPRNTVFLIRLWEEALFWMWASIRFPWPT
jgi:dihydrodiol dehydrogenase / D-xylose 1-dehydrogenase (NADP)